LKEEVVVVGEIGGEGGGEGEYNGGGGDNGIGGNDNNISSSLDLIILACSDST
jgi:hypothetical protein